MGAIKTTPQVGQAGEATGNTLIEITYGGLEAPFGGIDASAPPAYIDGKCFADADGFLVVDQQLVVVSTQPTALPTLWGGVAGVTLLTFGTFYTTNYGQLNYVLGYKAVAVAGSTTGVQYTFYMTSWAPSNPELPYNDTYSITLYNSATPATYASLSLALDTNSSLSPYKGSGASIAITTVSSVSTKFNSGTSPLTSASILSFSVGAGGSNYTVGEVLRLFQNSWNTSAYGYVTSIGVGGAITGFTLYSSGYNYSTGSASLIYENQFDIELIISGPSGSSTYDAIYPGPNILGGTTTTGGKGASVAVLRDGSYKVGPGSGGSGYAVGELYVLYENNSDLILGAESSDSVPPFGLYDGFKITSINATGGITELSYASSTNAPPRIGACVVHCANPYDIPSAEINITALDSSGQPSAWTITTPGTGYTLGIVKVRYSTAHYALVQVTAVGSTNVGETYEVDGILEGIQLVDPGYNMQGAAAVGLFYQMLLVAAPIYLTNTTDILNFFAEEIDGTSYLGEAQDQNVTASVNSSISSLTITANTAGAAGNSIAALDTSFIIADSTQFYYYFNARTKTYLTGGAGLRNSNLPLTFSLSPTTATVGSTLYVGNIGSMILKYSGPATLTLSSSLQGARVLRKFAGSLIGIGVLPAPGTVLDSSDMVLAWTEADALDVWNTLDSSGNITGAGLAQMADVGDYLSGLIVSNNTAFVIRAQGVSYMSALSSGTDPFQFAHISLGDQGEGCQIASLICQFDQTGVYVGNTDIYQISGSLGSIGAKIKKAIYASLIDAAAGLISSGAAAVYIGGNFFPLLMFQLGTDFYSYNAANNTWMKQVLSISQTNNSLLGALATESITASSNLANTFQLTLLAQSQTSAPSLRSFVEGLPNLLSISTNNPYVTFPQEELLFGRDVTIDALYISLFASVTEDITVNFYISEVLFSTTILSSSVFYTLQGTPIELQIFPTSTTGTGVFTAHSPQLKIELISLTDTGTAQVRFVKIQMYGSFDANQRPV